MAAIANMVRYGSGAIVIILRASSPLKKRGWWWILSPGKASSAAVTGWVQYPQDFAVLIIEERVPRTTKSLIARLSFNQTSTEPQVGFVNLCRPRLQTGTAV